MNLSTAIFLINSSARAVAVSYEVGPDGKGKTPFYTFKTLDRETKVGDFVVIPTDTRHGMTIARVEEIDVEVDHDSAIDYKWVLDTVDLARAEDIKRQEAEALARIKSAEARAKREELARKLLADNPDLTTLPIVDAKPTLPRAE